MTASASKNSNTDISSIKEAEEILSQNSEAAAGGVL